MLYRFAPDLVIHSHWRRYRPRPQEKVLVLKSGNAFPPGHPSTRLCLELLVGVCKNESPHRLLDVGCGSGVLSLAGAILGTPFNAALDISAAALRIAKHNAQLNRISHQVHWLRGSTEALQGTFDLILANLPWALQIDKIEEFERLSHSRTTLILAGLRDSQENYLLDLYRARGWYLRERLTKDLWELELPAEMSFTWVGLCLKKG